MGGVAEWVGEGPYLRLRPIFVILAVKCDSFQQK